MRPALEAYLARLGLELRRLGLVDARIVEEARGHLTDATEQGIQRGLSLEAAERDAIARFGAPEVVAMNFATERYRMLNRMLFVFAIILGLAIAYVDSRPSLDDAGVTAFSLALAAAMFGLISPQRPWLWALAIGIWIPLDAFMRTPSLDSLAILVVLTFPLAGAYAGMAARRAFALTGPHDRQSQTIRGLHDRTTQAFHVSLHARAKRGHVLPELSEPDLRAELVSHLERATRDSRALGASGAIQSLALLEDATVSGKHIRRYRAVFDNGAKVIVVHASDGRSASVDATPE